MADVDDLAAHLCSLDHGHDGPCWDNLTIAGRALKWLANRRRPAVADLTIPDEAVDAYVATFNGAYRHPEGPREEIRAGLAAAYPHLAAHAHAQIVAALDRRIAQMIERGQHSTAGPFSEKFIQGVKWAHSWLKVQPTDALLTRPEEGTNA